MAEPDPKTTPLPLDLEEMVFEIFFGLPETQRDAALAELAGRYPDHQRTLEQIAGRLAAGAGVFADLADLADLADPPGETPASIGPYRVLSKLGEGGFGVVYLAQQESPIKRRVAVKCLLPGMDSRRVLARFEAERQALALMNHPNIAQVYDAGSADQRPYFVMEHVAGVPITTYCDEARLGTRQRIAVFIRVCEAVQHAHQKGIIHRDIKPSNLLVAEQDGRAVPKVIDFGIAKAIYQPLTMRTVYTEVGRMVGTPEYMSPEQTSPTPLDVDTRTDVYSLGVVLYELLAGSLPFSSEVVRKRGINGVHDVIRNTDPMRPSARIATSGDAEVARRRDTRLPTLVDEVRGDLDWIILRAIEKERARRYGTAQELAADLGRYLADQPVMARPPRLSYLASKFVRRHRAEVITAALLLVALVAGLISSLTFYLQASDNLANYDRLADVVLLRRLQQEQQKLWPARPERIDALGSWLHEARGLRERAAVHRATRDRLLQQPHRGTEESGDMHFESGSTQFLHDTLASLVTELEEFGATVVDVEQRLEWAGKVRAATIEQPAALWAACRADVASDPRFAGLQLEPQLGLVPIDRHPTTGLWEFNHLRSGAPSVRSPTGAIVMAPANGLVFVLVPGGKVRMGAQKDDPKAPNYVASATPHELPVVEVEVGPFLISKFELTQAQWQRLTGTNPSRFQRSDTTRPALQKIGLTNPVESVSYDQGLEVLGRLGLTLPSEAQWEFACRAGTVTAWSTGDTVESLRGYANLADEGSKEYFPGTTAFEPGFFDGHGVHAPVGSFRPNGFGLYDMHGNIAEWVLDWFSFYENPTDPGTGLRRGELGRRDLRVLRGGSFNTQADFQRAGFRSGNKSAAISWAAGLRPARAIE